MRAIHKRK